MIAVLQLVTAASVVVAGETVGKIGAGLLILLGVSATDESVDAEALAEKISKCRIFEDEAGKMNRSLIDVGGGALVVSNFTLLANYAHGNRPDYLAAARPEKAEGLYLRFVSALGEKVSPVEHGVFGAEMKVMMEGDGPITIVMDSRVLVGKARKE